jgi:hypothetical protein
MLPVGSELGTDEGRIEFVGELDIRPDGPRLIDGEADGSALPDG